MKCKTCKIDNLQVLEKARLTEELVGHHVRVQKMGFKLLKNVMENGHFENEKDKEACLKMVETMKNMNTLLLALTGSKGMEKMMTDTGLFGEQQELFKEEK